MSQSSAQVVVPPVRLAVDELVPHVNKAMGTLDAAARKISLEPALLELVRLRASQINGCAYCIDMHTHDARVAGETEQRLYCLSAWRECPFYTDRERAALEWTEAVTLVSQTHVPDDVYERVRAHYPEKEIVDLTIAVGMINMWNRVAISFRAEPGKYQPPKSAATTS